MKTGFVSLIGRPSTGKSTLINKICGFKISGVSGKPQTTQFIIRGIYNDKESQIIFIDTPGYHNFNSNFNKGLSNLAIRNLDEGDIILYLVDITRVFGAEEEEITGYLKKASNKIIVAYNKIDKEPVIQNPIKKEIGLRLKTADEIEISGLSGENIDLLLGKIKNLLPEGPLYYPDDFVTDQSIPFRITEIIKEKIFNNIKEEIPHSIYIDVENLEVKDDKITAHANIFVEKESQKGIVIGNKASMIKMIGEQSRLELQDIFERKVNLFLNVKLHHNWRKDEKFLRKKFEIL